MLLLDRKKKISKINRDIREGQAWNTSVPSADEGELDKVGVKLDDGNVIFSGAVDSSSDSEDAKLARPDAPGVMKVQNDIKLAKFY